jgi:eukaryotic-like serine/threonine-protein kinase
MRTCAECHKEYPDDVRQCPVHGTALGEESLDTLNAFGDTLSARVVNVAAMSGATTASGRNTPSVRQTPSGQRDSSPALRESTNDSLVGSRLSERYDVTRKIGEGGMGVVYEAKHALIGKRVAIKVLLDKYAQKADIVARLQQEARLASSIGHEHIVDITDFGETHDGRTYVVMEFLEGESLAQLLAREGPLPPARAVGIVRQVSSALGAAHEKGIVHRDVKPENVFIIRRSDKDFVKVVDFGISKAMRQADGEGGHSSSPRLTHTGMVLGTPLYMSPEQARGEDDLDHRIDVYAVGVILYELLTGETPFRGSNYLNVISQVLSQDPRPLSRARPDLQISLALESIVMKAMAKDRVHRYPDMAALDADLARIEAGDATVVALSDPALRAAGKRSTGRSLILWIVGVALVIGGTVAIVVPLTSGPTPPEVSPPVVKPATSPSPVTPPLVIETRPAIEKVAITVTSTPPGADVYWDSVLKGKTPYTDTFNKNDETIKLTLALDGYEEAVVPFQPSEDRTVPVTLKKLKKGAKPKPRPDKPVQPGVAPRPGIGTGELKPNPYEIKP